MKLTCIIMVIACGLNMAIARECKVSENGKNRITMENNLISVRLLPEQRGVIDDMRLKSGSLQTLVPFEEKRVELIPGTGVYAKAFNAGNGCRDALWPRGVNIFKAPYRGEVVKRDAAEVVARMTLDTPSWKVVRTLSLQDGRSSLDGVVALTYKGDVPIKKSYWFQSVLRMADTLLSMPGDDSEILLMPAREESKAIQGISREFKADEIVNRNPEDRKNHFVPPAQPWMASVDRTEKLIYGVCFEVPNFPRDMIFYSWPGDGSRYSMEAMYPVEEFQPGEAIEHKFRIIILSGLADIDILRPDYALLITRQPEKANNQGELEFKLAALSPIDGKQITLRLGLRRGEKEILSEPFQLTGLSPEKPVYASAIVSGIGLTAGNYDIFIQESDGGKFDLVGEKIQF